MFNIDQIEIIGLHGYKNFRINFENECQIFLSENGWGKTTILKIINYIISADLISLKKLNFLEINYRFKNGISNNIKKDLLEFPDSSTGASRYLQRKIGDDVYLKFIEYISFLQNNIEGRKKAKDFLEKNGLSMGTYPSALLRDILEEKDVLGNSAYTLKHKTILSENNDLKSLYLPTYRRIEDELITELDDVSKLGNLINFGVGDVEKRLEEIRNSVLAEANKSMTEINGEILTKLVNGLDRSSIDYYDVIDAHKSDMHLVLKRVGKSLSENDKNIILSMLNGGDIYSPENNVLAYFLSKICKVYNEQKINEQAMSSFSQICSDYFFNKEMIFDENDLSVKIFSKDVGTEVKFNQLSSGEKQIVSIFSKLYLSSSSKFAVLFDEPELSLSVEWQEKILSDVLKSESCGVLIAMTHSPFIFSNLTEYTTDIREAFFEI